LAAISIALGELAIFTTSTLGYDEGRLFDFLSGLSSESTGPARQLAALADTATARLSARLFARPPSIAALHDLLDSDRDFAESFQAYRREYGCRTLNYELATAALGECPDLILSLVCDQIGRQYDPSTATAKAAETRSAAAERARAELTSPEQRQQFDKVLARAQKAYPVREDNEYWTVSAPNALVRWAVLEAAGRLVTAGKLERAEHVFFVELDELRETLLNTGDLRQLVRRRRGEHLWALRNPGPPSYGKPVGPPPSLNKLPPEVQLAMGAFQWSLEHMSDPASAVKQAPESSTLKGAAASGGRYTGPARVVRNETEFTKIRSGDVLVCPITSPVWSVVFPIIGALVTDTGGSLSHAAIIAREYGIPATLATGNATNVLVDGTTVTVDGSAGTVEIHSYTDTQ
jgi:phosphohistidine swiveling domain-containing protein